MLSNDEQFLLDVARDYKNAFDLVLCENEELKNALSEAETALQTNVGITQRQLDKANSALLNEQIKFQGLLKVTMDVYKVMKWYQPKDFDDAKFNLLPEVFAIWNILHSNQKEVV